MCGENKEYIAVKYSSVGWLDVCICEVMLMSM